jgi:hypothetical protein
LVSGGTVVRFALAALAVWLLVALYHWDNHVDQFGDLGMDDDRAAVRYALGAPDSADKADRTWSHRMEADAVLTTRFDAAGKVSRMTCLSPTGQRNSCPELFGFGIGTSEDDLAGRLGLPSRQRIVGTRKHLFYDGLGAIYVLERFQVIGVERLPKGGSFLGKTWGFVRSLVYLPGRRI